MKNYLLAPFLGALAMFVWGFLYYGLSGIPYQALQPQADVGKALDSLFPETGTYIVPDPRQTPEELEAQMADGPFATVHIKKGGMPAMDPAVMIRGFALEFVTCAFLVVLLGMTGIHGYGNRVIFILIAAILTTLYAHGGQAIWWHQDWGWQFRTMIHDVVAWGFAGLILAKLVTPASAD